ncbi:hypothetical protein FDF26_06205 [Clostridium botulinum]|nr:hypothetical protein [Clostridium botulinum]
MYECPICGRKKYVQGVCLDCQSKLEREAYESLSDEEINIQIKEIINNIKDDEYIDKAKNIISYTNVDTSEIAEAACNNEIYYPKELYKDASEKVRGKLIERLKNTEHSLTANKLLECLAIICDDVVLNAFYEFEKNAPKLREKLYVNPSVYAESGGWTFDENKKKINLAYDDCYVMFENEEISDEAIIVGALSDERCSACNSKLVDILSIDGNDERLKFINLKGKINIKVCLNCLPYEDEFCKFDLDGRSELMQFEGYECDDDDEIEEVTSKHFTLSKEKVSKYYGSFSEDLITIGGRGNFVNDCIHLECPCCKNKMKYLAQIQSNSINFYDGTMYFYICEDCKVVGINYQQT